MSTPRPWPPPPRLGALAPQEQRLCDALAVLALLLVAGGLIWPLLLIGSSLLDRWLPGVAAARYAYALIGPTLASWGLLAWFLIRHGIRRQHRWACDALLAATLTWLPLDAGLCYALGFRLGIAVDLLVGGVLLTLLLILRPHLANARDST
ncbi:hypothetical protein [Solimonas marina]|uniref:Uncharacterized protein n=1 Tax=Solimonas marina TaxID=2714601 RepID=A0A969W951_9GAMM|nr:hypothetical protein [Solimonas marina]NKF21211.1 hypothetical protein [Solimonas marina]